MGDLQNTITGRLGRTSGPNMQNLKPPGSGDFARKIRETLLEAQKREMEK